MGKFTQAQEAGIASAYSMGIKISAIRERFSCSRDKIYTVIKAYKIKTRNRYGKNSIRRKNE